MLWAKSLASAFKKILQLTESPNWLLRCSILYLDLTNIPDDISEVDRQPELNVTESSSPIDSSSSTETKVESNSDDKMILYNSKDSDNVDDDMVDSFWDDWTITHLDWNWV
ncbi:hypothetical protein EV426DRAFT_700602 [Tirmania nivea]|nr:hypothetical protein EV426DRAFT_700602 [Tirmania nivea]